MWKANKEKGKACWATSKPAVATATVIVSQQMKAWRLGERMSFINSQKAGNSRSLAVSNYRAIYKHTGKEAKASRAKTLGQLWDFVCFCFLGGQAFPLDVTLKSNLQE